MHLRACACAFSFSSDAPLIIKFPAIGVQLFAVSALECFSIHCVPFHRPCPIHDILRVGEIIQAKY